MTTKSYCSQPHYQPDLGFGILRAYFSAGFPSSRAYSAKPNISRKSCSASRNLEKIRLRGLNTGLYRNASVFLLPPQGLNNTPPGDFISFLRWRPQTGSRFARHFSVWRTRLLDGWQPSEGGPVDFSRRKHQPCVQ